MANSYEYLSILLLLSSFVSGGIGSESTYSCDLQHINPMSTISLGDREEGKISDCIQIGWIESQKQFGLDTGESAVCSKTLSSECHKTDQLTSSNDEYEFTKTIGNDTVGFKVNCKIDVPDGDERKGHIDVWECGDNANRYYILKSASVPEGTISKRGVPAEDKCGSKEILLCYLHLSSNLGGRRYVLGVNKTQVIQFCSVVKTFEQCMKDILKQCSSQSDKVERLFSGFTSTMNKLCDFDSEYSKAYLKQAPCMYATEDKIAACASDKSMHRNSSSNSRDAIERLDLEICCGIQDLLTCTGEVYNQECGSEASEFGSQMAKTMLGPAIQDPCTDSHGNFKCSATSGPIDNPQGGPNPSTAKGSGCNSLFSMSPVMPLLSLAALFVIFRRLNHSY